MIPQPLDHVPLFQRLSEEERELLSSRLRHLDFNTNDVIFAANKPADMFGVVAQGWVKLEGDTPQGRVALASLGAGSVIGEVDLLLNRPYSTYARAASTCTILALSRQDLEDLILENPEIGLKFSTSLGTRVAYLDQYLVTHRLCGVSLLSSLSDDDLHAIAGKLQFHSYERGETIFEAGAPADAVYLIESGAARLVTASREGEHFEELNEGDLFGQTALVTGKPYSSTARAVTDLNSWVLSRSDFQDLIQEHPTLKLAFARALAEGLGAEDQTQAIERLHALPLFADADSDALRAIAERLVLRHFPAGELIYTEGTPGDAMYFVESGTVRLVSDAATEAELLDRKTAGESFGEMALLTGRTRAEAAKALDDTTVWVLYKTEYDDLIVQHPALSLALSRALSTRLGNTEGEFIERHLRQLSLFNGLSPSELREIGQYVKPLRFRPGETICFAGQPAQCIYIIEAGEVREIAAGPNGQNIVLDLLGSQQSFGEQAVVQSSTFPVTLQAVGDVEIWTISKTDFDRLIARYPALALSVTRRMADELTRASNRPQHFQPVPAPRPVAPPRSAAQPSAPNYGNGNGNGTRPLQPQPVQPYQKTQPPVAQPTRQATSAAPFAAAAVGVRVAPSKPWQSTGSTVVRPMPAATARPTAAQNAYAPPRSVTRQARRGGFVHWFSNLSTGNKIAAVLISLFALWIVVMLPLWLVYSVLTAGPQGGENPSNNDLPYNLSVAGRQISMLPGKIGVRVKTPTPTALPPTPVPPTAEPTRKPAVVKKVAPVAAVKTEPTVAPTVDPAIAIAASVKPLAPIQWDSRLGPGGLPLLQGIGVENANVAPGQSFWRLVIMKFQDAGAESGNDHTIYITLLDGDGNRVNDQAVEVSWDESGAIQRQRLSISDEKPKGDYCQCNYNWPMYGGGYRVRVDSDIPSDKVFGMIMPMKRHVNYRLTFQRVVMP